MVDVGLDRPAWARATPMPFTIRSRASGASSNPALLAVAQQHVSFPRPTRGRSSTPHPAVWAAPQSPLRRSQSVEINEAAPPRAPTSILGVASC